MVKMGALEGVFDVFVLFHAGSGSPLHALMSWCSVWCWPSNLLWCSGPGVHPSILPLSRTQIHSYNHTFNITRRQILTHLHCQRETFSSALLQRWWWNEEECVPSLFILCLYGSGRGGDRMWDWFVCLHVHVYVCWQDDTDTNSECSYCNAMKPFVQQHHFIYSSACLYSHHDRFFFSVFFPPLLRQVPPKTPIFVQVASTAFQTHNCFPMCALLFPGMLISCDDQRDIGIKVLRFKHFVVFMLLP